MARNAVGRPALRPTVGTPRRGTVRCVAAPALPPTSPGRAGSAVAAEAAVASEHRQVRFSTPPGATELLVVRHGESAAFRPEEPFPLVDGHGDPPLRADGEAQAAAVAERLRRETIH